MKPLCFVPGTLVPPIWIFIGIELGVLIFSVYICIRVWRLTRARALVDKLVACFFGILFGGIIFVTGSIVVFILCILILADNIPPSAEYPNLNAAVKNTCFLDPARQHCPRSVEDLINIQRQDFVPEVAHAHLTYQYYPETNDYTLIIRNDEYLWKNNDQVVVFDSRLPKVRSYSSGLDFVDTQIVKCGDTYRLITPPPFSGPWDSIQ